MGHYFGGSIVVFYWLERDSELCAHAIGGWVQRSAGFGIVLLRRVDKE